MEKYLVFGTFFLVCIFCIPKNDKVIRLGDTKKKRIFVLWLAAMLFLLGALRNVRTGIDTYYYARGFLTTVLKTPIAAYWKEAVASFDSEQGYFLLAKLFSYVLPYAQAWLAFLCLLFVVPCAILIYRYSECPPVSILYIAAMGIYTFCWQGLRQSIAMSICLFAFLLLLKRKRVWFILLVLLAFQFHRSSIVFLLALPAMNLKVDLRDYIWIAVAFLITLVAPGLVNGVLLNYFNFFDKVEDYASGGASHYTYTMFFILLLLYVACFLVKDELIERNPVNKALFNMAMLGVVFQAMAVVIAEFFRISYYFSVFNMLLVANAGQVAAERYPKLKLRLGFLLFIVFIFFATGGFDYWFLWESKWSF